MSLWRDEQYVRYLGSQLERFKEKRTHLFNCRCFLCGDSALNKFKARGYFYPGKTAVLYSCHNCHVTLPLPAVLYKLNRRLYDEYLMDRIKDGEQEPRRVPAPSSVAVSPRNAVVAPDVPSLALCRVSTNANLRAIYDYAVSRQLRPADFGRLYGTTHAPTWLAPLVGEEKASRVDADRPYLVIPLCLETGEWYGAQLRALDAKQYTTFRWNAEPLKVFGLDAWEEGRDTLFVEGPLDALFLPNALACCSSDLLGTYQIVQTRFDKIDLRAVFLYDNERRNTQVLREMRRTITKGYRIIIWPRDYPKDVNDVVRAGLSLEALQKRVFSGLQAELELREWVK